MILRFKRKSIQKSFSIQSVGVSKTQKFKIQSMRKCASRAHAHIQFSSKMLHILDRVMLDSCLGFRCILVIDFSLHFFFTQNSGCYCYVCRFDTIPFLRILLVRINKKKRTSNEEKWTIATTVTAKVERAAS